MSTTSAIESPRRSPGARGLATRQRLLEVTADRLVTTPFRDLSIVDIARDAGVSPATFYQYFPDIEAALVELADQLAASGGSRLHDLIADGDWSPAATASTARGVAHGFLDLWDEQRVLLAVIDLLAAAGDQRFRDCRTRLLGAPTRAFETVAVPSRRPLGRAEVGVLVGLLAHTAAHRPGLEDWGASVSGLTDSMARHIAWAIHGPEPRN